MTQAIIKLGPILGLEGDYRYTISFVSQSDFDPTDVTLELNGPEGAATLCFDSKERLHSTFLYKVTFNVAQLAASFAMSYILAHNGQPMTNKSGDAGWNFAVPGDIIIPKIGFASCNGDGKTLPENQADANYVMWERLLSSHKQEGGKFAFHCLILGGDQVYADPIWEKIDYFAKHKLLGWRSTRAMAEHKIDPLDLPDLTAAIEGFYESLYINSWSRTPVSNVLASIPTIMMWDDHDIFDGWGSHPEALQSSDVFQLIYRIAKKYFGLLQIRGSSNRSLIAEEHYSLAVSFRNFEIIALDNRSHRTQHAIMSDAQYEDISTLLSRDLFKSTAPKLHAQKVMLFVVPVPIAHLNYKKRAEGLLKWLFRSDFRRSLNDDGLDHWDHHYHDAEQKRLIDLMFAFGDAFNPKYVHIISGDVHSAGAGRVVRNGENLRIINQFISSAIVYKPVGKIEQFFIDLMADKKSEIEGYQVGINEFGVGRNAHLVIYQRNFGFFYKAEGLGLKAYLTLEDNSDGYDFDQPAQYKPLEKDLINTQINYD